VDFTYFHSEVNECVIGKYGETLRQLTISVSEKVSYKSQLRLRPLYFHCIKEVLLEFFLELKVKKM
jgi:hypothetical protein